MRLGESLSPAAPLRTGPFRLPAEDPWMRLMRSDWARRPERLDIKFPILGFLMESEMTGYGLKRTFESALGFTYRVSDGSLYPALKKLAHERLVTTRRAHQGRRASTVYAITPAGRTWFLHKLAEPSPPMFIQDEAQTKLFFADYRPDVAPQHLARMRRFNERWAAELERLAEHARATEPSPYRRMLIEMGLQINNYCAAITGAMERKLARELRAKARHRASRNGRGVN